LKCGAQNCLISAGPIVQCYAPTEDGEADEKESFYSVLDKTLVSLHRSDIVLMMGDFNAKVGCNNEDVEHVMGKHGTGDCNENVKLLIETCGNRGLMIGGTISPSSFFSCTCDITHWHNYTI
jgi:hypothetical protein